MFIPYLVRQLLTCNRLDVVFDVYLPDSLKQETHQKRGKGSRINVAGHVSVPNNWQNFLRVNENKTEPFDFLCNHLKNHCNVENGKVINFTNKHKVLCLPDQQDDESITPCTHEGAGTKIMLHTAHAVKMGLKKYLLNLLIQTSWCLLLLHVIN